MNPDITPLDLHRMFLGDGPPLFYVEVLLRTLIIYGYTLLMIRWIGGRGIAQMSMVEFVLVIALGSAVGDSMFYPDVPVLIGMLVITVVIGVNKLLDKAMVLSDTAKAIVDGQPVELVADGQMTIDGLEQAKMGSAEVKALLRQAGISNLGSVSRAYLENGGSVSVFKKHPPQPGLSLIPPQSVLPKSARNAKGLGAEPEENVGECCTNCGAYVREVGPGSDAECENCGSKKRVPASIAESEKG